MCFEPGTVELEGEAGQAVRFGERLGTVAVGRGVERD
jgi:hypothetical protein